MNPLVRRVVSLLFASVVLAASGCHGCGKSDAAAPSAGPGPSGPISSCNLGNGSCRESAASPEFQSDCTDKKGKYAAGLCPAEGLVGSCVLVVKDGGLTG